MTDRQNTVVCSFDPTSPRITAYDIHEWIHEALRIPEHTVSMIQIDGIKRQVYIKLIDKECVLSLIRATNGQAEYKHHTGELSIVNIAVAGMGTKRVRIANLPPEVPDDALRTALTPFGTVMAIQDEMWSKTYRYVVANGIRLATIMLTKHVPSHLTVSGHRVLLSYEGQPTTCYGCGETGHLYPTCPQRQTRRPMPREKQQQTTYASIAAFHASPPVTQSENEANNIIHTSMKQHIDTMMSTSDIKDQATDVSMTEIEATTSDDPEKLQTPTDKQDDAASKQRIHNRTGEATASLKEGMGRGEQATQESTEHTSQKKATGKSSADHPTEHTRNGSKTEDMTVEQEETELPQDISEGIQDDVRLSPKRIKKMKIEKTGELPTERTRNATRRAAYKNEKS